MPMQENASSCDEEEEILRQIVPQVVEEIDLEELQALDGPRVSFQNLEYCVEQDRTRLEEDGRHGKCWAQGPMNQQQHIQRLGATDMNQLVLQQDQITRWLQRQLGSVGLCAALEAEARPVVTAQRTSGLRQVRRKGRRPNHLHAHYQARLRLLDSRIKWAVNCTDLVFQQRHLKATPTFPGCCLHSTQSCSLALPWCRELRFLNGGDPSSQDDLCAELAGYTICCFDAPTLTKLLWHCFIMMTCDESVEGVDMAGNVFESFRSSMTEEIIHGTASFEMAAGQTNVKVRGHGAVRQYPHLLVWESVGRVDIVDLVTETGTECKKNRLEGANGDELPKQMEFTRTVWLRIEQLSDGRSVLHHVQQMRPVGTPVPSKASPNDGTQWPQLQICGEVLHRVHMDMSSYFHGLIVAHVAKVIEMQPINAHGWPIDSTW